MTWPQKNSYRWGKVHVQGITDRSCIDTRRAIRASSRRRTRCWNRSHPDAVFEGNICHKMWQKSTKSARLCMRYVM